MQIFQYDFMLQRRGFTFNDYSDAFDFSFNIVRDLR